MGTSRTKSGTAFAAVIALFFAWGFISSNNEPLIASLRVTFALGYGQALMTQLVFFAAFGVASLPAAAVVDRWGTVTAICISLATMIVGCLLVAAMTPYQRFDLILIALFVLGVGITSLQVAANPLAASLGRPEQKHFRLTLAQAFNSLGVVIGSNFGAEILLAPALVHTVAEPARTMIGRGIALRAVASAFEIIALMLSGLLLLVYLARKRMRDASQVDEEQGIDRRSGPLVSKWTLLGMIAIALYVGAEVSIASIMINYLNQPAVLGVPLRTAGLYLGNIYWMGALIGRFAGSLLLLRIKAPRALLVAAATATLLCLVVISRSGAVAGYSALAIGLCNSIMFPTIFTLALERSEAARSRTSGLLCLAIVGGAALPYLVGIIADRASLAIAFSVPMVAYAYIAIFAFLAAKARKVGPLQI